tara:strand:- start:103 stop:1218 length:1116 start_codon:yes stop_codon:yes gene_type:complete
MKEIFITGTGFWKPNEIVTNDEIVNSYNAYVDKFNEEFKAEIASGQKSELSYSSSEFIEKASGIKTRYILDKKNVLDPDVMKPTTPPELASNQSLLAEISIIAANKAMESAKINASEIDAVIMGTSHSARNYPAIAIEVQEELGITGYGYDMLVGCSSTTFAISNAFSDISSGLANNILVINPELTSPANDFTLRDSHFIFGDACVATIVQSQAIHDQSFKILNRKLVTQFSNNIRSDFSYMNRTDQLDRDDDELLFRQNGRSVFKEVCPMVVTIINQQLTDMNIDICDIKRLWLHQANGNMISYVAKKLYGDNYDEKLAPMILAEYGNVASAGSVIAFNQTSDDFISGDKGVICSFGAGYSICSLVVEKV